MGQKLVPITAAERDLVAIVVQDDFVEYVSGDQFTTTVSDIGTVAATDAIGGILLLTPSDGTVADNDEAYVATSWENFLIEANKPIRARCRLRFVETNTDDANVFFGLLDAIGANTLVDDGAGMKTSFSGAAIYKVDGGTVWKCVSSLSTTQTVSTSTTTAGGTSYQELAIDITPVSSTVAEVSFFVDGAALIDSTSGKVIKHNLTYTSATEMDLGAGVKNGSANLELLRIDYMFCAQNRA